MAKMTKGKISDLKQDIRNLNKGSEYGKSLIDKSIEKFGAGRGIVTDKHGNIIGGNHIAQALGEKGIENVVFVETIGKELVVTRRMDIDKDTPEGRDLALEMGLADNQTNKINYILDADIADADVSDAFCDEWGVDGKKNDIPGKLTKENLEPYEMTHILISFPPEKLLHIQTILEGIKNIEGVEYEQSSN